MIEIKKHELEEKEYSLEKVCQLFLDTSLAGAFILDSQGQFIHVNQVYCDFVGYSQEELLALHISDIEDSEYSDFTQQHIKSTATRKVQFESNHRCKDGDLVTLLNSVSSLEIENKRFFLFYVHNITNCERMMNLLHIQRDLGIALSLTNDLQDGCNFVLEAALELEGVDCGGVYLRDLETGELDLVVSKNISRQFEERVSHFDSDSPQANVFMKGKPIYGSYTDIINEVDEIRNKEGLRALAVVPLKNKGQIVGVLNLASHTHKTYHLHTCQAIEAVASRIGGFISHVKAKMALKESEEKLKSSIASMSDSLFLLDRKGVILDYFPSVNAAKYSFSAKEFLGKSFEEALPQQEVKKVKTSFDKVMATETTQQVDFFIERDDKKLWFSTKASIRKDSQGNIAGLTAMVRDITEQKMAEHILKEREEFFRGAFEYAGTGMALTSPSGQYLRANKVLCDMLGFSEEELLTKTYLDFTHPEDQNESKSFAQQLLSDQIQTFQTEKRYINRHEKTINVLVNVSVVRDINNNPLYHVIQIQDITKLKQSEKMIKTALSERDVLLKEIHHRVKNNMQIMSSLLKLQSRYINNEQDLEIFKVAQNRIRAMAFIHEILYHSKDLARINFSEYVGKVGTHLRQIYTVDPNAVKINKIIDGASLSIDTAIPCGLIINELVSNSLGHAFPSGQKGEICVEFRSLSDKYQLTVHDNGVGFPKDLDFCNTDSLGLQLVVSLTEQLDGSIELERTNGTKFTITFSEN